jgi:phosphoribosylformylglycinamidine synthase
MAFCGIDTAIRNVVAVGANPERIALLDNFCWCSSDEPFRLGQLKRTAEACSRAVLGYGAPLISGKDSMFNDFKGFDASGRPIKISVPPTLLISSLGQVEDVKKCVTLDAKAPGDLVYLIGETDDECGGSEYYAWLGESKGGDRILGRNVPQVDIPAAVARYRKVHRAIQEEILASCSSLGMGGLAVGLAKMAMAGELGLTVDLDAVPAAAKLRLDKLLFSESQSRFLVTVAPAQRKRFEAMMSDEPFALIGRVTKEKVLLLQGPEGPVVEAPVAELKAAYKKTLDW